MTDAAHDDENARQERLRKHIKSQTIFEIATRLTEDVTDGIGHAVHDLYMQFVGDVRSEAERRQLADELVVQARRMIYESLNVSDEPPDLDELPVPTDSRIGQVVQHCGVTWLCGRDCHDVLNWLRIESTR